MGNDGGSIPTRRELVKSPTRQKTHSQIRDSAAQTQAYHWTTCPLSKRPLSSPVVSDALGRLFNKDSVLEWLLRGTEAFGDGEEVLGGHVKGLKDVVEVRFEVLPEEANGEGRKAEKWVCSVSRKELGPGVKSVYLVPCGHAFAESAIKEIGGSENGCLVCSKPYEKSNIIPINSSESKDVEALQVRMKDLAEKGLTHALKKADKSKKRKKGSAAAAAETDMKANAAEESGIKNAAAASLTTKVLEDEKINNKKRKMEMSDNVKSLFSKGNNKKSGGDFMTRGYSLPAEMQR